MHNLVREIIILFFLNPDVLLEQNPHLGCLTVKRPQLDCTIVFASVCGEATGRTALHDRASQTIRP